MAAKTAAMEADFRRPRGVPAQIAAQLKRAQEALKNLSLGKAVPHRGYGWDGTQYEASVGKRLEKLKAELLGSPAETILVVGHSLIRLGSSKLGGAPCLHKNTVPITGPEFWSFLGKNHS